LSDGSVEVIAAGLPAAVEELAGHLYQGPRLAHVVGVDQQEAPLTDYAPFRIRV
jgi:acylphosphatase